MYILFVKVLRDEEVFGQEPTKPGEAVETVQLLLLDQVGHPGEAADAKAVKSQVVPGSTTPEVHLNEHGKQKVTPGKVLCFKNHTPH